MASNAKPIANWSYLREYQRLKPAINRAVQQVFASGRLILGPQLEAFEQDFANWVGATHGIGCNSGTDALFLALRALEIGPGDEVITVPNTAVPTVAAIRATGAKPVFVDIDPNYYLMAVEQVEAKITKKTKAILPVHLYGQSINMAPLLKLARKHNLAIVEDCAQSHGAKYLPRRQAGQGKMTGTLGTIGAFSFYPTKVLGAYGDAGMCVTSDPKLAKRLKMLRFYGMAGEYYSEIEGYNSRLDEVQAAIIRIKLKTLGADIDKRRRIARMYDEGLAGVVQTPQVAPWSTHSYYLYVCRHPKRDQIIKQLKAQGIEIKIHFPFPIHLMRGYRFLGCRAGEFSQTEAAAKEIFSLPMYPDLPLQDVKRVIKAIKQVVA